MQLLQSQEAAVYNEFSRVKGATACVTTVIVAQRVFLKFGPPGFLAVTFASNQPKER